MTYTEPRTSPYQLKTVLDGLPEDLLVPDVREKIARLCIDCDVLGRLTVDTDEPLIDEHTLRGSLRNVVDAELAEQLVGMLAALPHHRLRLAQDDTGLVTEPGWYELAERVVIYDTEPDSRFSDLRIPFRRATQDVVSAVQYAFPSLEPELLDPAVVPRRIAELVRPGERERFWRAVHEVDRQLGWWAALAAVLLVPLAVLATTEPASGEDRAGYANAWPLGNFALAAAVGGWTLTVVDSVLLAPLD